MKLLGVALTVGGLYAVIVVSIVVWHGRFYDRECTFFPEGAHTHCCLAHDEAYHAGGSSADRLAADRALRACMDSGLVYWAVRIFGPAWWGR